MVSCKKTTILIFIIFLLSVPLVFAADLPKNILGEEKQPIIVIVHQGSKAISDSLSAKSEAEKPVLLATATKNVLKDVKYPYTKSEITILKYKCDADICGYWISATRGGREVYTNSPIWISPPPYEIVVSEIYDSKTNIQTVTVREDPKAAAEQVLQRYVDGQPLGKAVSYER